LTDLADDTVCLEDSDKIYSSWVLPELLT